MSGNQLPVTAAPVAAWFPDMFYSFYLVKDHKIAKNSRTPEAREKISTYLESLEF